MKHRRFLALAIFAALSISAWSVQAQHEGHGHDKKADGKVTLEGEVLDMYCFMKHPDTGQGAEHAKCATKCITKGLPIGFLVGEDVYLIVGRDHESAAEMVKDFAGMRSRMTGTIVTHHGVKAIEIEAIEKL